MDSCDEETLAAFQHNCRDEGILNVLARHHLQSFYELSDLVSKYCAMEDTWHAQQEYTESTHESR